MVNEKKKQNYIFHLGSPLPKAALVFAYVLVFIGIVQLIDNPILGIPLTLFSGYLAFQFQGSEIDLKEKRLRFFTSYLGIRFGKWLPLENFPFVSIIRRKTTTTTYSRSMQSVDITNDFYSVVLLSKSHRTKLVLLNKGDMETCAARAAEISESLGLPVVPYNPQISKASQQKRRIGRR